MTRIFGYFITGIAILLPLGLTIYVVYKVVVAVDSLFNLEFAGLGLLIVIIGVTMIGMMASLFVGRPIFLRLEKLFIRTPIFGYIYKAFKDLTKAFVGNENKFSEPVMVRMAGEEVYKIGFITTKDAHKFIISEGKTDVLCGVYFPISYSIAGDLYFVPLHLIKPLNISPKDAMQYVVSGGIINVH